MKKFQFLLGVAGFLALGLTGCSNDDLKVQDPQAESDQTRFIAVQISAPNDALSRSFDEDGNYVPDLEDGTTNESYVSRLDFLFYDVAGNPTSAPQTISDFTENGFVDNNTNTNVTRMYVTTVPVNLVQGQNLPSQVICIVNGEPTAINELRTKTLTELVDVTRNYFRNGSSFLMSNSVYYGQNTLTGQANQRLCATPINTMTQLFTTEEAAKDAITNNSDGALVDIYVERVAAKVGLTMAANAVEGYTLVNGDGTGNVTLTFAPEYWAMNATADNNYLTKRYGVDTGDEITLLPTYTQINTALSDAGWTYWNDPERFRSYWGCSPSYFENKYPDVSDDVDDLENRSEVKEGDEVTTPASVVDYPVTYYSYNGVKAQAARPATGVSANNPDGGIGKQALAAVGGAFSIVNTGASASGFIYTRETTVASKTIKNTNANPAAAVASAILVGKYNVTGADVTENGTFFIDRNAGVINNVTVGRYYGSVATATGALASRQSIVFTANPGTTATRAGAGIFTLKHPSYTVRQKADVKLAGRLVALQIETLPANPVYFYSLDAAGEGHWVPVTEDNLDEVNVQLLSVGYLDMYANGHAFYSVPIRHINWNNADNSLYNNGAYNWANMPVGALGIVRNHVYNLTIRKVSGLASGVRSDDQPMVPAKEETNQFIAARINILSWNVANTWSVDL